MPELRRERTSIQDVRSPRMGAVPQIRRVASDVHHDQLTSKRAEAYGLFGGKSLSSITNGMRRPGQRCSGLLETIPIVLSLVACDPEAIFLPGAHATRRLPAYDNLWPGYALIREPLHTAPRRSGDGGNKLMTERSGVRTFAARVPAAGLSSSGLTRCRTVRSARGLVSLSGVAARRTAHQEEKGPPKGERQN